MGFRPQHFSRHVAGHPLPVTSLSIGWLQVVRPPLTLTGRLAKPVERACTPSDGSGRGMSSVTVSVSMETRGVVA